MKKASLAPYKRIYRSIHSILHSLRPRRLRSHSTPMPVHSAFLRARSSATAPTRALAVVLNISRAVALKPLTTSSGIEALAAGHVGVVDCGRGSNQLLLKSKKH